MASGFDFSDHKAAAYAPQMTLDMYLAFPEDASKLIEVVDGWIVRCESAEPSHQAIQLNLLTSDGEYTREGLAIRDRDFHAIDTISPFPLRLTWEALDEGL